MRQFSFVFLWLLVFIMPWQDIFAIPGLASGAKLLGLVAFLLGLVSALFSGQVKLPLALVWVALFGGWCAISTEWTTDREMAMSRALSYAQLLTFVWLICQLADSPPRMKWRLRACVLGTAMTVANIYLGYVLAGVPINEEGEVRYTAVGTDNNAMAGFCALSMLFAYYLIARREKHAFELPNWFYWGFIIVSAVAILLTGSRAGRFPAVSPALCSWAGCGRSTGKFASDWLHAWGLSGS